MKETNRAIRRHNATRLKKARSTYWGRAPLDPRSLGRVLNTPHPCSCWACCNGRKTEGITLAERIQMIDLFER